MAIAVTTKIRIRKPVAQVYEALVDPAQIQHYWWSSSSARWAPGQPITVRYAEYNAEAQLQVLEAEPKRLLFKWPDDHLVTYTLTELSAEETIIQVTEVGWSGDEEGLHDLLTDNKGGWTYMLTCLKAYLEHGITDLRGALVLP